MRITKPYPPIGLPKEIKRVCQVDFIWIFTVASTGQKGLLSKLLWAPLTCSRTTSGVLPNAPDLTIIPERVRVWVRHSACV